MQWVERGLLGLGIVLLALIGAGQIARTRALSRLQSDFPPPGRLIAVDLAGANDPHKLHLYCQGTGSPTVILETGLASPGLTWALVQPEVARFTQVCVYDRSGVGWSEPSRQRRRVDVQVAELHMLLERAGIERPVVLAGYSSGGWLARMYAHTHPEEVAGMVLVDSAHEDQFERLDAQGTPLANYLFYLGPSLVRSGIPALFVSRLPVPGKGKLPADAVETYQAMIAGDVRTVETMAAELSVLHESLAMVRAAGIHSLGDIPLVVLAHTTLEVIPGIALSPEAGQVWLDLQREMAALSPHGRLVLTEESGHDILFDQPELVAEALQTVVESVQGGKPEEESKANP